MPTATTDPIRSFERTKDHLSELSSAIDVVLCGLAVGSPAARTRRRLITLFEALREELLRHFAIEEEGLFPFLRAHVPGSAPAVERLALGHDAICEAVVHLAQLARSLPAADLHGTLRPLHARFEAVYAAHSREEAALLDEVARALDERQRRALIASIQGL